MGGVILPLRYLAPTGLAIEKIREITKAWRKAVAESTSTGARMMRPSGPKASSGRPTGRPATGVARLRRGASWRWPVLLGPGGPPAPPSFRDGQPA
jgi:hypothetical protein